MKFLLKTAALIIFSVLVINLSPGCAFAQEVQDKVPAENCVIEQFIAVNPVDLVNNPDSYLDKDVKILARFHKFSTLGLDYDKAMRDSKDHISVLIRKPGVPGNHIIPFSELKLIIKREQAEKFLDMESGDEVLIKGKVFSSALSDPWIDIYELKSLEPQKAGENESEKKAKK